MEGTIVPSLSDAAGTGGFGYDPLFFLPQYGKTAAQLTSDEKNAISHRGKATRIIEHIISTLS
jgi:XTP/dITP diphosphohydrolase